VELCKEKPTAPENGGIVEGFADKKCLGFTRNQSAKAVRKILKFI
jgi:hypothetical protein